MSSKVTPHTWIPSHYIRVLFSKHLYRGIVNNEYSPETLVPIVNSVYSSNIKLVRLFHLPDAVTMADDLYTLHTGTLTTNPYVEALRWVLSHADITKVRKITSSHAAELLDHLKSIGCKTIIRTDDSGIVSDIVEVYTAQSFIIIMLQCMRA